MKRIKARMLRPDEVDQLMECGHFIRLRAVASYSDFPNDGTWCPQCQKQVQLDPALRKWLSENQ